jgi:uncharacterized membrane protein YdjX (TVP38/TMEM64 family)
MTEAAHKPGSASRRRMPLRLLAVLGAWGLVVAAVQYYAWREQLAPPEVLRQVMQSCRSAPTGPLLFVGVAALSPLLLVPAALLGALGGACFGPAPGIAWTLVGCNLSALLAYGLGRLSRQEHGRLEELGARYGPHLQHRPLLAVIVLRLSFLPYDPINYLVGLLRVPPGPFLLGNTLGSLPGVIIIVLAGNAAGTIGEGGVPPNPATLLGVAGLIAVSVALAAALRRRPVGSV